MQYRKDIVTSSDRSCGITLNDRKTQIIKLSHGFVWLQDRIYLLNSGKIVDKPGREAVTRNRRKLKKLAKRLDNGEISYKDVRVFYASHLGYLSHKDAYRTRCNMDKLYNELVIRRFAQ